MLGGPTCHAGLLKLRYPVVLAQIPWLHFCLYSDIREAYDKGLSQSVLQECITVTTLLAYPMVPHITSEVCRANTAFGAGLNTDVQGEMEESI